MSVIAAIADRGITITGCDQRAGSMMVRTKWVRRGDCSIGVSGTYRVIPLLASAQGMPQEDPFAIGTWIRDVLAEDGFQSRDDSGGPKSFDIEILLARPGRLWLLDASLTPIEVPPGEFMAVGSGREYARGAAHALSFASPADQVRAAVQAAIDLEYETCGGKPVVETV